MARDDRSRRAARGYCIEARAHTDALLELVRRRKAELESFEAELNERRQRLGHLLRELGETVR